MNKKINWQDVKNIALTVLFSVIAIWFLVITTKALTTDWEGIGDNLESAVESMGEMIDCEIDYKEFHYKGLCIDKEEILEFLVNQTEGGYLK